jgi:hypothetical protein
VLCCVVQLSIGHCVESVVEQVSPPSSSIGQCAPPLSPSANPSLHLVCVCVCVCACVVDGVQSQNGILGILVKSVHRLLFTVPPSCRDTLVWLMRLSLCCRSFLSPSLCFLPVRLHGDVSRFDALHHVRCAHLHQPIINPAHPCTLHSLSCALLCCASVLQSHAVLSATSLSSTELHRAFTSSDSPIPPSGLPSPSALATAIRARLEEGIQGLTTLLDTKAYMTQDTAPGQAMTHTLTPSPHSAPHPLLSPWPSAPPLSLSQPSVKWRTRKSKGSGSTLSPAPNTEGTVNPPPLSTALMLSTVVLCCAVVWCAAVDLVECVAVDGPCS